jgi:hypothetical protein
MSFLTTQQRTEINAMVARYDAAVVAGKTISDPRVHAAYKACQHLIGCDDNGSTNTAFHGVATKQLVEWFALTAA